MKVRLIIRTDSLTICDREVEAPRTIDAVIAALNGSAGDHLRDLGRARIHIEARSAEESIVCGRNLNQAASECRAPREEAGNA